jgi:hypothetical protein
MQMLDDLGAVNHLERVVFVRPNPIEVYCRDLDASGFGLLFERRGSFDAVEELRLVIQITEQEAPVRAPDIQQ